jgi:Hypothetical protein (DUF2513)
MKRDMDLIRDILLWIEAHVPPTTAKYPDIIGFEPEAIGYHLVLLLDGQYVIGSCMNTKTSAYPNVIVQRLSNTGHDYLDQIRDPEVWKNTKKAAESAGGFTLELLGDLAKGFIKTQIKKQTGMEL